MMHKTAIATIALAASMAGAQTVTHQIVASQFSQWRIAGTAALTTGANAVVPFSPCAVSAGGTNFQAVTNGVALKIVDPANPSVDEVVTPSSVVVSPGNCTASITTVNAHPLPYYFISGTQGLQEAIDANALSGQSNVVILDRLFHQLGGGAITAYSAAGKGNLSLLDVTVSPYASFRWNGSNYAGNYTSPQGTVLPTLAAAAAAGTSPTVSNVPGSLVNLLQASVTTGTSTTAGALFTETYPATGSFTSAANCTVQSVGASTPPAFTVADTYNGSNEALLTVSVASAPAASTTYLFNITCQ
jgi:hypothetical protein